MNKAERVELDKLFQQVIRFFKKRCYTCRGVYNMEEAWVLHHRDYKRDELIYSDFKKPDGKPDRLEYYRYLIPIVLKNPKRFRLLHHKHHYMAENMARPRPEFFERNVKIAREINKRRYPRR